MFNNEMLDIVTALSEFNGAIEDSRWVEANGTTVHITSRVDSEPSGSFVAINEGVTGEVAKTKQIEDYLALLEAESRVDDRLFRLHGRKAAIRGTEDMAFVRGIKKNMAAKLFYANRFTTPREYHGLANRFNALSDANVIGTGGTGSDLSSIWIIAHDELDGFHMLYPQGHKSAGIESDDLGLQRVLDASSNPYPAWVTWFRAHHGFAVKDERNVQRIANIETAGSDNIFDPDDLVDAISLMTNRENAVIYCNRTIKAQIDKNALGKSNGFYMQPDIYGRSTPHFWDVPIRLHEQLLTTESQLS